MYKGTVPKKPKQSPSPPTRPSPVADAKKTEKMQPKKPAKDPLQSLREAREEERMIKFQPKPVEEQKSGKPVAERKPVQERKPVPIVSKKEEKPTETETEGPIEQDRSPESTSPSTGSSGIGPPRKSDPRPIPPAPPTDRRILYASAAAVLFLIGVILYKRSTAPSKPPIVLAGDSTDDKDKSAPKTKDLSAAAPNPRRRANVAKAIEVLQNVFEERCSTSTEDLVDFGGEGILALGEGRLPRAVVWPTSTEEVEVILKVAETYRVPVIPYSGGTSLEG